MTSLPGQDSPTTDTVSTDTVDVQPDTVFRRSSAVRFRVLDDEGVVIHQKAGEVLVVNEVGARVLQLLDGKRTVGAVVESLTEEWQVTPEDLRRDVEDYLRRLVAAGIVEGMVEGIDEENG